MAIRRQTNAYWERRALQRLTDTERASLPHLRRILQVYDDSRRRTVRAVQEMYGAYYTEQGWNKEALFSIAPSGDIKRFQDEMRRLGLVTALPDNYKGRMTRLELINAQMWAESKKVAQQHTTMQTAAHAETVNNAFNRTLYDVSRGTGSTPSFNKLNTATVNQILGTKFYGKNYSERIWSNTDILAGTLKDRLAAAIATGQAPAKTMREVRERYGVGKYQAQRLVQTETNYFENYAEIKAYGEMGIAEYVFMATLDGKTSEVCREHDGKRYKVKDKRQGENAPPMHGNCRSTTRPYIGKEYEPETRIARNTDGKNVYVTNMGYEEWKSLFVQDVAGLAGAASVVSTAKGIVNTSYGAAFDSNSLWGVNSEMIADTAQRAENLLNVYQPVQDWVKSEGGLEIRGGEFQAGTIATTRRNKPVITISRAYYGRRARLEKTVAKSIKKGLFMPAEDVTGYAFNHEFGHLVQNFLLRGGNTDTAANRVRRDIIGIAKSHYKLTDDDVIGMMSKYAKTNSREFFGEAFANLHSGRPNQLGKAMGIYLKGVIK